MGCTLCARRSVSAEHSERPRYLTFFCSTNFAMAATVCSIGLDGEIHGEIKHYRGLTSLHQKSIRVSINAVAVVEINIVGSQTLKRSVTCFCQVFGIIVDLEAIAVINSKLGSQEHLLSSILDNLRDDFLTVTPSINI